MSRINLNGRGPLSSNCAHLVKISDDANCASAVTKLARKDMLNYAVLRVIYYEVSSKNILRVSRYRMI